MWPTAVTQQVQRTLWGCQPLSPSICQTESKLDLSMDGTVLRGAGWGVGQDMLPNCQSFRVASPPAAGWGAENNGEHPGSAFCLRAAVG